MKREFVPYELAVKLKALGFDEPCLFGFDNCSTPMRCSDLRTNDQKFNGVNYNSSTYTSQPTFSQAFRWFREKYGLLHDITLTTNVDDKLVGFYMLIHKMNDDLVVDEEDDDVEVEVMTTDKDEAELACLEKLIEIVESKPTQNSTDARTMEKLIESNRKFDEKNNTNVKYNSSDRNEDTPNITNFFI